MIIRMERSESVDILKGVGMLSVIWGHTIPYFNGFIYTFHMPLFFLMSGYYFNIDRYDLKKDFKRLMFPYFFTSFLILLPLLILCICGKKNIQDIYDWIFATFWGSSSIHNPGLWGSLPNVGTIWFLLALFEARFFYYYLYQRIRNINKFVILLCCIFVLCVFSRNYIQLPFSFQASGCALLYLLLGRLIRNCKFKYIYIKRYILLFGWIWIFTLNFSQIDVGKCLYKFYFLDVISSLFVVYCLYKCISKCLELKSIFINKVLVRLSYFGYYSLVVLCFHNIELKLVSLSINFWGLFILRVLFSVIMIEIVRKSNILSKIYLK